MRDHLKQVEKQTGEKQVNAPEPPANAKYLYLWFWDISRGRGQGFSGQPPLTAQEIKAWADLSGIALEPWEFRLIRSMDSAFLDATENL